METHQPSYVLVTPVRNEESTIGITLASVIAQTIRPVEWVVVSDQSSDQTDEIIQKYALEHPFIKFMRLENRPKRNFASVVFATEHGIKSLKSKDYDYIGLLDADIKMGENYYEQIIIQFSNNPRLGLAGGAVIDCYKGRRHGHVQSVQDVAGSVQFFRRECFAAFGGLVALPEGGWDAITCAQARMLGYETRVFSDLVVDHLKPRNIAEGNISRRFRQFGERDYALGYHPIFEVIKCGYRSLRRPVLIGGFMWLAGYIGCYLRRKKRLLPPDLVRFIREEQLNRLLPFRKKATVSTPPPAALKNGRQPVVNG